MGENDIMDDEQTTPSSSDGSVVDSSGDSIGAVEVVPMTEEEIALLESGTLYAVGDTTGYGTISDSYLDYFEGIVQKLTPDQHYVIWKSGDYSYTLAYGESIKESTGIFTGACDTVQIYRDASSGYNTNWYTTTGSGELSLNSASLFVYSDLGMYPTVERGFSSLEAHTILFAVGFAIVFSVCHDIFDYVLGHLRR